MRQPLGWNSLMTTLSEIIMYDIKPFAYDLSNNAMYREFSEANGS